MLGSEVRQRGEVKSFGDGVREGAKGLFYGYWDGITGLVTEPIAGGKKEVCPSFAVHTYIAVIPLGISRILLTIRVHWAFSRAWDVAVS